jgi:hypothetical protein
VTGHLDRARDHDRDRGMVTPVETMYLLVLAVAAVTLLGYLGRLHASGVEVSAAAQAAARAASLAPSSSAGAAAARATIRESTLRQRCAGGPHTEVSWVASPTGTWHGGAVTVTLRCTVSQASLAGIWAPGSRTFVVADTQPIDRFRR